MAGTKGHSGRKRKPVATLKLQGTYRKDRHANHVPTPPCKLRCPAWLDDYGKKHFRAAVKVLSEIPNLLASVDADALAQYAAAWSDFQSAHDHIKKHGAEIEDTNGIFHSNPAVRRKYKAAEVIRQIMCRFGMTPSDRAGLHLPEGDDTDAMTEFLEKRMMGRG